MRAVILLCLNQTSIIILASTNCLVLTMTAKRTKTIRWKKIWFRTQKHTKTTESQSH
jgi:hypothetical protein